MDADERAVTTFEWIVFVALITAIWPVDLVVTAKVSHRAGTGASVIVLGLVYLCSPRAFANLYNRTLPDFLASLRMSPWFVRVIGVVVVAGGVAKLFF